MDIWKNLESTEIKCFHHFCKCSRVDWARALHLGGSIRFPDIHLLLNLWGQAQRFVSSWLNSRAAERSFPSTCPHPSSPNTKVKPHQFTGPCEHRRTSRQHPWGHSGSMAKPTAAVPQGRWPGYRLHCPVFSGIQTLSPHRFDAISTCRM